MPRHRRHSSKPAGPVAGETHTLRIIGGDLRGRKLACQGHSGTRPMKDRVREAVFNLVGTHAKGMHAVDLFAGTGALGFEAISRGAALVTFIEQHFPSAQTIRQNAATLGISDRVQVFPANVFLWNPPESLSGAHPWLVFCSPPYSFFLERQAETLGLLNRLIERAPAGSRFVVESDNKFDTNLLPAKLEWDVRPYPPAVVAVGRTLV